MTGAVLDQNKIVEIKNWDQNKRLKYLLMQIVEQQQVWILTDEHGAVMLTTDDDDGIPVWPHREFAEMWATGEWQGFDPKSISLKDWQKKWTVGLADDELCVVAFPLPDEDGILLDSYEFDEELEQQKRKLHPR